MLGAFEYETQMSMEGTVLGEINKSEQTEKKRRAMPDMGDVCGYAGVKGRGRRRAERSGRGRVEAGESVS